MVFIIVAGHIDLSVGSVAAFIVTLAGMLTFRGLALVTLGNQNIGSFPTEYRALGNGFLSFLEVPFGARDHIDLITLMAGGLAVFGIGAFTFALAQAKGLPITLIVLAALVLVYGIIQHCSVFGRHVYAIGGNRHAAELSGIKTRQVDFWLFVNMGLLAALAGVIFTARLNLAGPKAGDGFELEAISAAFIGGLIIGVLNNGMSLMGIGIEWQQALMVVRDPVLLVTLGALGFGWRPHPAVLIVPGESTVEPPPDSLIGRMLQFPRGSFLDRGHPPPRG